MKPLYIITATLLLLLIGSCPLDAQEGRTMMALESEAVAGLDLRAVSELFKESENLESFERSLNDPEVGVNNLDLDEDGRVDFIRVLEEAADDTHLIILQVPLAENEFQDVAVIEVEGSGDEEYNLQVHGNEVIYGVDYYVAPVSVHIHSWPVIAWLYRPVYRPYRSVFSFGFYPAWWRPYRPVALKAYRTRTVKYTSRTTFTFTKTRSVKSVTKVKYKPRSSSLVKKRMRVHHAPAGPQGGKKFKKGVKKKKLQKKRRK